MKTFLNVLKVGGFSFTLCLSLSAKAIEFPAKMIEGDPYARFGNDNPEYKAQLNCMSALGSENALPIDLKGGVFACESCKVGNASIVFDSTYEQNLKTSTDGRSKDGRRYCGLSDKGMGCFWIPENEIKNSRGGFVRAKLDPEIAAILPGRIDFEVPAYKELSFADGHRINYIHERNSAADELFKWMKDRYVDNDEFTDLIHGGIDKHQAEVKVDVSIGYFATVSKDKLTAKAKELGLEMTNLETKYSFSESSTKYKISGSADKISEYTTFMKKLAENDPVLSEAARALRQQLADESFTFVPRVQKVLSKDETIRVLNEQALQSLNSIGRVIKDESTESKARWTKNIRSCQAFAQSYPEARKAYCDNVKPCDLKVSADPAEAQKNTK